LEQLQNGALVGTPCFDLAVERHQTPFQHGRRIALAPVQNGADVCQRQPGMAIGANLLQAPHLPLAVPPVVGGVAGGRFQQPDGFVVQQRAAAQTAMRREF